MTVTADHENRKRVRSVRMFDDTWDMLQARRGMVASTLVNDMTEAGLGFARCFRCFEPVKVEYGDLTGKPLAAWVEEAGKTVTRQHRDGHHPITVGRDAHKPPAPRPAPGSAVFLEPGGSPVITAAVPDRKKRQRR